MNGPPYLIAEGLEVRVVSVAGDAEAVLQTDAERFGEEMTGERDRCVPVLHLEIGEGSDVRAEVERGTDARGVNR